MEYKVDAQNKILGRLATQVADLLRGKNSPTYEPTKFSGNKVTVFNTNKIAVTGRKLKQKMYRRHSGYIGGLKEESMELVMQKDSRRVIREAVSGMLPKNRTRAKFMKNLILVKGNL
jgi:large subunit ribosomal protein L13